MTDPRPENDDTYGAPDLSAALNDDGTRWRAEQTATAERIAQRLESAPPTARGRQRARHQSWRWPAIGAAAVVLIGAVATLLVTQPWRVLQPQIVSYPPPQIFSLSGLGLYAKTAQEAFAQGFNLTPCVRDPGATLTKGAPPQSESVTWLYTSDNYGMIRLHWTCKSQWNHEGEQALVLARNSVGQPWGIRQGAQLDPSISTGDQSPLPSWLALPSDHYQTLDFFKYSQNETPAVSAVVWFSSTRTYVLGHSNDTATRPADATTVQIDGQTGWATATNGYVVITVPQPDHTIAFFSGTGSLASVESLASAAIAHMSDELLPLGS